MLPLLPSEVGPCLLIYPQPDVFLIKQLSITCHNYIKTIGSDLMNKTKDMSLLDLF